ncbi:uncharacterized protein A1O5_04030 [Cladophialophora psammophila CBS 110553]|uniref:Major facilitator superfamily (MFS) profile domain-containing protein n=1 Tax=Cladophialophora psammophila CBS 110553 TaxID=1182543 RepID=W9WXG7_9EURO|nr:uncharacterized protein A1O5_04030 [Cladophialophora psammophila CBS 110553]EXJ72882.1 hypothetical protein A1O5_04030 [Cladophialophora psammophila CBS 110553]
MQVKLRGPPLSWAITLCCASAYLLYGYDEGVVGGLVSQPSFLDALGNPGSGYLGTIIALYDVGCMIGCVTAAIVGFKVGRRYVIFGGCMVMIVGAAIQTSTHGAGQFIAGRIICGIGNGLNTSTIPVYVSETTRSNRRGSMVAVQLAIVIFGLVVAYWVDYGTVHSLSGEIVWRFPIAFQIVFAVVTGAIILLLPESPRFLYNQGEIHKSAEILSQLMDVPIDDASVIFIQAEMEAAVRVEKEQPFRWKRFFEKSDVKTSRRLVICFMLQMFQQFTGIHVTAVYATVILTDNVGLSLETSSLVAGFIQLAFFVGTLPPIFMIDRYGRRRLLLIGAIAMAICMSIFTAAIAVPTVATGRLALAMLILYELWFGATWNCTPWIIAPEITPLHLRHVGGAICAFSEWLWTFVIVLITPAAIRNTGWRIYILFCIMCVVAFVFVWFFLPETAGKTLEEIDYIFATGEAKDRLERQFLDAQEETLDNDAKEIAVNVEGKTA